MTQKTILITGGAKRVGAEIARYLHQNNHNIIIHYNNSYQEALKLSQELNFIRENSVKIIQGDLLDTVRLSEIMQKAIDCFGKIDALINNASSFFATPIGSITENHWHDLIGSNLKAPLFLSQLASPFLKESKGCIINIVDIHADRPMHKYVVYSIAKAGLVGLTKSLAIELAPEIRVNGVAPGAILWPNENQHFNHQEKDKIIDHSLLKREGQPLDIAKTICFLINDAPYITGQIIAVDGGRSINL